MQGAVIYLLQKEKLNHSLRGVIQLLRKKQKHLFVYTAASVPKRNGMPTEGMRANYLLN